MGAEWTGTTECERTDGNWIPFRHEEPRTSLFVPGDEEHWTGRRHTTIRYVVDVPFGPAAPEQPKAGKPAARKGAKGRTSAVHPPLREEHASKGSPEPSKGTKVFAVYDSAAENYRVSAVGAPPWDEVVRRVTRDVDTCEVLDDVRVWKKPKRAYEGPLPQKGARK